jgi:hypothetical protein
MKNGPRARPKIGLAAITVSLDRAADYPRKGSFAALSNQYYRYIWWGVRRDGGRNDVFALGNKGQFIGEN